MSELLTDDALNRLFRKARTVRSWLDTTIDDQVLKEVYDLAKMGPTSANSCPLRVVFVKSKEAKIKLRPCLDESNMGLDAPVTAILGMEVQFYRDLPRLFPQANAADWFKDLPKDVLETIALRNSSLQAAYFMLAARALGLDCGPRSRFSHQRLDAAFFAGTTIKSNFLCNLGYRDPAEIYSSERPRLEFADACVIV
jgi:3-hydroxypropanoate dehydrogenase